MNPKRKLINIILDPIFKILDAYNISVYFILVLVFLVFSVVLFIKAKKNEKLQNPKIISIFMLISSLMLSILDQLGII